ncbi:hypothetical protein [Nitrosopumilus sp.]|uniref:hypothetical protein n=1 Tax=Nitrosopumilus sp. TaxID=2024843 RepID=UPI003D1095B0
MKARTVISNHILEKTKVSRTDGKHLVTGDRQTGKTTANMMGSIIRAFESEQNEYHILVMTPNLSMINNLKNMIFGLSKQNFFPNSAKIQYGSRGNSCKLTVDDQIITFDFVNNIETFDKLRGYNEFDFGIIENFNYMKNYREVLNTFLRFTKDFVISGDSVL